MELKRVGLRVSLYGGMVLRGSVFYGYILWGMGGYVCIAILREKASPSKMRTMIISIQFPP